MGLYASNNYRWVQNTYYGLHLYYKWQIFSALCICMADGLYMAMVTIDRAKVAMVMIHLKKISFDCFAQPKKVGFAANVLHSGFLILSSRQKFTIHASSKHMLSLETNYNPLFTECKTSLY
jgi:hypothetical protein